VSHDHHAILTAIEKADAPVARGLAAEHILSVGRAPWCSPPAASASFSR